MYLKIQISSDKMEATIEEALIQQGSKKTILLGIMMSYLSREKISPKAILRQNISKIANAYINDGISLNGEVVARGKYPVPGKNSIHLYFNHTVESPENLFEDLEQDIKQYGRHLFLEGDIIGEEGEPTEGKVGYNLYGEEVAATPGKVVNYDIDSRTVITQNNRLIARVSGLAFLKNGVVQMIPLLKLLHQNRVLQGIVFPLSGKKQITMDQIKGMVATLKLKHEVSKTVLYHYMDQFREGKTGAVTLLSLISDQKNQQFLIPPFTGEPELLLEKFGKFSDQQRKMVENFIVTVADQIIKISDLGTGKALDLFGKTIDISEEEIPIEPGRHIEKKKGYIVAKTFGILYKKDAYLDILPLIDIASDRMSVQLTLLHLETLKMPQSVKDILLMLDLFQIKYGISHAKIEKLLLQMKKEGVATGVIARGTEPVYGRKGKVISLIEFTKSAGVVSEDGSIDFRERSFIQNVKPGDPVAEEIPEIAPVDRCDVYGRKIKAEWESKDTGLTIGQNIEQRADGIYCATIQGIVSISGKRLNVFDIVHISQDIDFDIGNIDATGMVQVRGSLLPGFKIKAKGDVVINGVVDNGIIRSGGNIIVNKGITGSGKSDIQCQGDLTSRFINNARVVVLGDLTVSDSIINSHVFCDGKITVLRIHGYIIGGEVYARNTIQCKEIGSAMGRETIVGIKFDLTADRILTRLTKQSGELSKEILTLQRMLGGDFMKNPREKLKKMSPAIREQMQIKLTNLLSLIQKRGEVDQERNNLIIQKSKDLDIKISANICYPGTIIKFNDQEYHVKDTITSVTFKLSEKGEIEPVFTTHSRR